MSRRLTWRFAWAWCIGFVLTSGATAQPPTDPGVRFDAFPPVTTPLQSTDRFLLAQGVQGSTPNPFLATLSDTLNYIVANLVPPGLDTQVIFNDGDVYGADAGLTFNKTTDTLTILDGFTISPTSLDADNANGPALLNIDGNADVPSVVPDRSMPDTGLWSSINPGFATAAVGLTVDADALADAVFTLIDFDAGGLPGRQAVFLVDEVQVAAPILTFQTQDTDGDVTDGEYLFAWDFRGTDLFPGPATNGGAVMRVEGAGDWETGSSPGRFVFSTTPVGGLGSLPALTIHSDQTLETPNDIIVGTQSVCLEDGTNCPAVAPGVTDKIEEGDSNVEVIDAGTGEVQIDIDGVNKFRVGSTNTVVENSLISEGASTTVYNELILEDQAWLYFRDDDLSHTVGFRAPADLTDFRTCVFEDDGNPIPDSCVGDGIDDSGISEITQIVPMTPASCQGTTAFLNWNSTTAGSPAAACNTGTNTQEGVADFDQTADECLQARLPLSDDWTGAVDVFYSWRTTATSGSVAWCTQIVCLADGEAADPAFPAQASGNCVTDTAAGTTLLLNNVSDLAITTTGCAASELMYVRTCRDPDETGAQTDTLAADARLVDMHFKMRRAL